MPELGPGLHELIEGSLRPLDVDSIVARRRRRRWHRRIGTALAAAVVIAIGIGGALTLRTDSDRSPVGVSVSPSTDPTTVPRPIGPQRYRIDALVVQDVSHGPELCIYPTAFVAGRGSDCGPRVANWDWAKVPSPSHAEQSTFGWYRLVGTYDGTVFTPTQAPVKTVEPRTEVPKVAAPCPTPAGGWRETNRSRLGLSDFQALQDGAHGAPDFAGMWMSSTRASGPTDDFQHGYVTVVAFTGDIARHRQELADLWGGPICVVQHPHSYAGLQTVVQHVLAALDHKELGVQDIMIGPDEVNDVVTLQVVAATPATQRAIDRRFGAGLVKVSSLMTPVP
jgi:hypothetical protein